jgi:hypothetical protein
MTAGTNLAGLLSVEAMPQVPGLATPGLFYLVIRNPAPLAGMSAPTSNTPWKALYELGLNYVVCLTRECPNYLPDPLISIAHFPLQDLNGGISPENLDNEQDLVYQACEKVGSLINDRKGVVVHCIGGTGRTGTVIGCVLRMLGYNSETVLAYLDNLNRMRGAGRGWPESEWQAELIINYPHIR